MDLSAAETGRLLGAYTASEAFDNAIGQKEDGEGFVKAAKGALDMAKLTPDCVAVVKTHGTGTKSNNQAEKTALTGLLPDFVATSYKQVIGHTMGVSGLIKLRNVEITYSLLIRTPIDCKFHAVIYRVGG